MTLYLGDCLDVMAGMEPDSVDSIVTDPPYALTNRVADVPACNSCGRICGGNDGVSVGDPCPKCGEPLERRRTMSGAGFMGKDWDNGLVAFSPELWREALRVAKPGAHLLAFGGTRTFHRLAVAIEDAGWEIRDTIMWIYGSGFPKSHNIGKAIDKAAGAERDMIGEYKIGGMTPDRPNFGANDRSNGQGMGFRPGDIPITAPATPEAAQWDGWGTALKPAWEPIILARKPFNSTVAANVLAWGTGAINVDGCRVGTDGGTKAVDFGETKGTMYGGGKGKPTNSIETLPLGRWPANLVHDGSDEVTGLFPVTHGGGNKQVSSCTMTKEQVYSGGWQTQTKNPDYYADKGGSASRFFHRAPFEQDDFDAARLYYCAKASKADRDEGLEGLEATERQGESRWAGECPECGCRMMLNGKPTCGHNVVSWIQGLPRRNHHPTVKPTALMRWLVRLITPPGGVVLDPFMGSGSTGKAAALEGMQFIGIEQDAEYLEIARRRIAAVSLPLLEVAA